MRCLLFHKGALSENDLGPCQFYCISTPDTKADWAQMAVATALENASSMVQEHLLKETLDAVKVSCRKLSLASFFRHHFFIIFCFYFACFRSVLWNDSIFSYICGGYSIYNNHKRHCINWTRKASVRPTHSVLFDLSASCDARNTNHNVNAMGMTGNRKSLLMGITFWWAVSFYVDTMAMFSWECE